MSDALDVLAARSRFPALRREVAGHAALFLDGPGGTQVPASVGEAMARYLTTSNANLGGAFITSAETVALVQSARAAAAAFLGAAAPTQVIFGQNMTSLTFAASRALAREWRSGDEIILTTLDHDANVAPWMAAAEDRGVVVRWLECEPPGCQLAPERLRALLGPRTRLVAMTCASNAVGTMPDLPALIALAHAHGALTYLDAVHLAPHAPIDVQALDCDFLACSAYKFCGPHLGMLYGRQELLERLQPYRVRPASPLPPGKWETGTQNFEAMAGLVACLGYLGGLGATAGEDPVGRTALTRAMERIRAHESALSRQFLSGLAGMPRVRIHGITDPARLHQRTPTFALTLEGVHPKAAAVRLAERGMFVWDGHFYALGVIQALGLGDAGGVLRIGFSHYTTAQEVERALVEVARLVA